MTDGLGGYATGTVPGLRTRREHALLTVAGHPDELRHAGLIALDLTLTLPSGARVPLYGSSHKVVDVEVAEAWLSLLLELDLKRIDGAQFAAAQLARLTGDRTRDIDPALRARTAQALVAAKAAETRSHGYRPKSAER